MTAAIPRNAPARVAHVLGTGNVGGAERQLVLLLDHLDRTRFEPVVLLCRDGPLRAEYERRAETVVLGKSRSIDVLFLARLRRELRRIAPDIVHTWMTTANAWGTAAAALAGVRHLVVSEGEVDLWKGRVWSILDSAIGRRADAVVGNAYVVSAAAAARGCPPERLRVVYNGVDLQAAAGADRQAGLIALIGRIDRKKGHDVMIEALPRIIDRVPAARLAVAGDAVLPVEKDFERSVRALADRRNVSDRIDWWGRISDPFSLLRQAAVAVVPSRSEGIANVVMEAMATSTPLVATDVGGTGEVVKDGVTGRLIPPEDVDALAGAVIDLLMDPGQAARLAATARLLVDEELSAPHFARSFETIYAQALTSALDRSSSRRGARP